MTHWTTFTFYRQLRSSGTGANRNMLINFDCIVYRILSWFGCGMVNRYNPIGTMSCVQLGTNHLSVGLMNGSHDRFFACEQLVATYPRRSNSKNTHNDDEAYSGRWIVTRTGNNVRPPVPNLVKLLRTTGKYPKTPRVITDSLVKRIKN